MTSRAATLSLSTPYEAGHAPKPADLAALADRLEHVLADGEPQKAKALLRLLIEELRVEGRGRIQPAYRLPAPKVAQRPKKWAEPDIAQTT